MKSNTGDLQKINGILVAIQEGQKRLESTIGQMQGDIGTLNGDIGMLKGDIGILKTTVSHIETAIDSLAEGQQDIRKSIVKQITNHERRLTGVEETAHSHKN